MTTFVCAFFYVPENKKNNLEHYQEHMPKTFDLLKDQRIVFFYEDNEILEYVKTLVKTRPEFFIPICIKITELPTFKFSQQFLQCCKNQDNEFLKSVNDHKGLVHYQREFLQSGEESYRKVISIWTSKIGLMKMIISQNPFLTDSFAWIDVSISRINFQYIDFPFDNNKINTNICWSNYKGERMFHSGGFIISEINTWNRFIPIYEKKVLDLQDDPYAHDEETIFHLIHSDYPDIFSFIT